MKKIFISLTIMLSVSALTIEAMQASKFSDHMPRNLQAKNTQGRKHLKEIKRKQQQELQAKQRHALLFSMLLMGAEFSSVLRTINHAQPTSHHQPIHQENKEAEQQHANTTSTGNATESIATKITPTIAHAQQLCTETEGCQQACSAIINNTAEHTTCAIMHRLAQADMQKLTGNRPENKPHLQTIITSIMHHAQQYPEHAEFFHGFSARNGLTFDVFTELVRQAGIIDAHNPSPLILRLFSEHFNRHAPHANFFLQKTFQKMEQPNYPDSTYISTAKEFTSTRELLLSTNVALGANCKMISSGECTLAFFLSNGFWGKDTAPSPWSFGLQSFGIPDSYAQEIVDLYAQHPELRTGQLMQIFIPKTMLQDCVYMSWRYGVPVTREERTFWGGTRDGYPHPANYLEGLSTTPHEYVQARIIPAPRYAKDFIVYRFFATQEATDSHKRFTKALADIIRRALEENPQATQLIRREFLR